VTSGKREPRHEQVFEALADATRREVVRRLSQDGPSTATELSAALPVSRQAVAKHLAALSDAGLVSCERRGREARYRLTPAPLADAVGWMTSVGSEWDQRLERLRRRFD
jgi:DNA-binding transcriptional ArsR family regulator